MYIYVFMHIYVFTCNVYLYQKITVHTSLMLWTCYCRHVLYWPDAYFLVTQNHQIHTPNTLKIYFPIIHIPDDSTFMMRWWILNNPMSFIPLHNKYLLRYCIFSIFAKLDFSNGWYLAWEYYWIEKTWSTKTENKYSKMFRIVTKPGRSTIGHIICHRVKGIVNLMLE